MIRPLRSREAQTIPLILCVILAATSAIAQQPWKPSTDWGHWRLGHRAELSFLIKNNLLGQQLHSNVGILTSLRQFMADELSFSFSASRVLADSNTGRMPARLRPV
jgi:hypothetical protein